jgi:hypothetical protein
LTKKPSSFIFLIKGQDLFVVKALHQKYKRLPVFFLEIKNSKKESSVIELGIIFSGSTNEDCGKGTTKITTRSKHSAGNVLRISRSDTR